MIGTTNLGVPARSSLVAIPLCYSIYYQKVIIFTAFDQQKSRSILMDYDAVPNQLSNHRTI
jgi:hypothetical protein